MPSYFAKSPARRVFQQHLGSGNHLIITALVGLDAIERGIVTSIPSELNAAWSPKDAVASSRRSRRLMLDMALVRSVDALDLYIRYSNRKPFLIQSAMLQDKIVGSERSIYNKILVVNEHFPQINKILSALVVLMITWRNRAVHAEVDNNVPEYYKDTIRANAEAIATRFRGLDGNLLLDGYEDNRPPYFKEVASFINVAHHYVSELELAQFRTLDTERFLKELVWNAVSVKGKKDKTINDGRKRLLKSVWGKDAADRKKSVKSFLRHKGLSSTEPKDKEFVVIFDDYLLADLTSMTPTEVYAWAKSTE